MSIVYRLQHKETKLGPFEHDGQICEVVNHGIYSHPAVMEDIDTLPEVKVILKNNIVRFGYSKKRSLLKIIKNRKILDKHGFEIVKLNREILFYNKSDNQVIFKEERGA